MRYYPAGLALALAFAVSASMGQGAPSRPIDPRAAALGTVGDEAMARGEVQDAVDAYEAALAVDPGYVRAVLGLARAARDEGLQGKAIHYYRQMLERDPGNRAAIAGEGQALVEKGAVEKARRNLAQLQSLCGAQCSETTALAAAIAAGPQQPVLTAEAVQPEPTVSQN